MMLPKITIITPSYNQGKYLGDTIRSVLRQEYPSLEYMVIDGGSQDNSVDVIDHFKAHLHYWVSEKDGGQSEAINKGLRRATGEIISWVNSDDQLLPGALHKIADLFQKNPGIDLIHGKTILFGANRRETLRGSESEGLPHRYLAGMAFPQPASFFSSNALKKTGLLSESLHYGMDYDFFARMYLKGEFLESDFTFSKYLLHDEGKTLIDQTQFAKDWAKVYSAIARSLPHAEEVIGELQELGLYSDGKQIFPTTRSFDKTFVGKTLLYFLLYQIVFYYQSGALVMVKKLTGFLKDRHPQFFRSNKLRPVYWRSRMLPPSLLQILRKI